ncbi:hypothetical protein D3C76_854290 [compost metagenome]
MGMYSSPFIGAFNLLPTFRIDKAATVPNSVATIVDTAATMRLFINASSTCRSLSREAYHSNVNPSQSPLSFVLLNEYTMTSIIGT